MKREIVLALHRKHVEECHLMEQHRDVCPMCDVAYREAYAYWTSVLEENLLPVLHSYEEFWQREGVAIGNVGSPALDIVHEILTHWIVLPPVEISDSPELYLDHPIVVALYEKENSKTQTNGNF